MPTSPPDMKSTIRTAARACRDALPIEALHHAGSRVAASVATLPPFATAQVVAGYAAFQHEVPTAPVLQLALAAGKTIVLPRVAGHRQLTLHRVETLAALIPGPMGVPEPPATAETVSPETVDLFLVPGVAFDTAGGRLGYGAGYYDGLLAERTGWRIALAHSCQIVPQIPVEPHDIPMHLIVTESGVIDCAQGRQATDVLRLRNMTFYGYHGAFPQERAAGIRLAIDVELRLDLQHAVRTDDLTTTVNYPAVYALINDLQSSQEFHLFEALAGRVAEEILTHFPQVREVTVRARKFNPPIGGLLDAFEVEVTRRRLAWTVRPSPPLAMP